METKTNKKTTTTTTSRLIMSQLRVHSTDLKSTCKLAEESLQEMRSTWRSLFLCCFGRLACKRGIANVRDCERQCESRSDKELYWIGGDKATFAAVPSSPQSRATLGRFGAALKRVDSTS